MIISCPNCSARYDIDDQKFLPAGRSVRCSDCTTSWFVPAPQAIETLLPSAKIESNSHNQNACDHRANEAQNLSPSRSHDTSRSHDNREDDGLFAKSPARSNSQTSQDVNNHSTPLRRASDQPGGVEDPVTSDRPQWGPMAERRQKQTGQAEAESESYDRVKMPRRRATDRVVDANWEEVEAAQRPVAHERETVNGSSHEQGRLYRMPDEGLAASAQPDSGVQIEGAPGEIFTAVSVQPKELEKALRRVRRKAEARDKNRLTPLRIVGWIGLFFVVGTFLFGGYRYRDDVVRIVPGSAKVYASIGIDASPYGLSLKNIDHRIALSTTGPIVEISGELHNQSEKPIKPPLLQAEALDVHGALLARWTFHPDEDYVTGGGRVSFSTKASAPEGIVEVVLAFAPDESKIKK